MKAVLTIGGVNESISCTESFNTIRARIYDSRQFMNVTLPGGKKMVINKEDIVNLKEEQKTKARTQKEKLPI